MLEWLWLALFVVTFILIFLGYPVAFSLGGAAVFFGGLGIHCGFFPPAYLELFPERVFGVMSNQVLLAVPFFIFMGTLLQRSGLAEDLLLTMAQLFGRRPGGLALSVVLVGSLLAAATGIVGASVVSMGLISLPIMLRCGYAPTLATGTICASGTLGQIIPPSIVLVVLADQMGESVGDLFRGALLPGLLLASLLAITVMLIAHFNPSSAPPVSREDSPASRSHLFRQTLQVMIPPLLLVLIVLGSIFAGIATPTEAGALGAVGAFVLAGLRGRMSRAAVRSTAEETLRLSTMVMFLLIGSTAFTLVFRGLGGDREIEQVLTNLPGGLMGLLIAANVAVFLLGFFIDFFEIAFIVLPLFVPAARSLGLEGPEMVWFGVMLAMNLQTSFLTPPFGFSLFYLRGVTPKSIPTSQIYRGVLPFIGVQLLTLGLVIAFPELVTALID
ncbi:MAG TPA: TRAP transporter large permease subunit [Planctomycetes bacterium]|nr:TRAP transporter large permease subunit [Planctomycetota bacterium]HIL36323.1 TRAP transporter large permease subunit [Planctomycetota bacterium]